jgi:predicted O-methyltransferase YrrM
VAEHPIVEVVVIDPHLDESFHPILREAAATTKRALLAAAARVSRRPGVPEVDSLGAFTDRWTDRLRELCELAYGDAREQVTRVLEIGAWEGRSTAFLATFFPNAGIATIDTFEGSDEQPADRTPSVEEVFDRNVARFGGRVTKYKGPSNVHLARLLDAGRTFDMAFVDGSHFADDVWVDTYYSWEMLRTRGILVWDDYLWDEYANGFANPRSAIDRFLEVHKGEYEVVFAEWLVAIRKNARNECRTLRRDLPAPPPRSSG